MRSAVLTFAIVIALFFSAYVVFSLYVPPEFMSPEKVIGAAIVGMFAVILLWPQIVGLFRRIAGQTVEPTFPMNANQGRSPDTVISFESKNDGTLYRVEITLWYNRHHGNLSSEVTWMGIFRGLEVRKNSGFPPDLDLAEQLNRWIANYNATVDGGLHPPAEPSVIAVVSVLQVTDSDAVPASSHLTTQSG